MKFVVNRIDEIIESGLLTNKTVLELGCVGMGWDDRIDGPLWIHGKVSKVSKRLVGLDINKQELRKLKGRGFDARFQNIEEEFDLNEKFDVILCEEVIEHVNNPGIVFENIKRHLNKEGYLVFSTPNPFAIAFILQRLLGRKISGVSIDDHTHWYDEFTLRTVFKRHGFEVVQLWYVYPRPLINKIRGYLLQMLWMPFPDRMGRNLMCIAKLKEKK